MPLYRATYQNLLGYPAHLELGAQNIVIAAEAVRRRLGRRLEFVLVRLYLDGEEPPPLVKRWGLDV